MVHTYSLNGFNIALDVFSGAVHVCDPVSLEAIRLYERDSRAEVAEKLRIAFPGHPEVTEAGIAELLDTLDDMKAQGTLYTEDEYRDSAFHLKKDPGLVKAMCLHVAHACNLTCSYCFAGQGHYQGEAALMPLGVGKKALDYLVRHSGDRKHLEVDFFGGEPLLNWDVVKALVAYGRSLEKKAGKVFRFTLTTNGMLLNDEVTAFCNREMHNVVLSLDGRREVHDFYRKDHRGKGSYEVVVSRFQRFVKMRGDKEYYIRGTYTRRNTDFLRDILHIAELGFDKLSMEPVVAQPGSPEALREEDLPQLFEQYEALAREMLAREKAGKGFQFYHYMLDLAHGPCVYKRLSGCGSGTEYLAVTPSGDLYPCHQFVGEEVYKLGSLDEGITRHDLQAAFQRNNVYQHAACRECWAMLYCAGGCAANACHATGSIEGVYAFGCELFKKRMECAIMLQAALDELRN
ncbi:MAG: thioether cross-link-forming SCIFF peptide maturase [Christensenellales bacterium]|jgi:uncharacterized protein